MPQTEISPIMYIDDDGDDHETFKAALKDLNINYPVITFWNGAEALEYLLSEHINPFIIFCDINMPKMNGFEFRKEINRNKTLERSCIPFIFYSTSAEKKDVDRAYDLTVQGYFKKPSDSVEIRDQLKRIIDYWLDCKHPNNC